jgi:hypothetical protein
MQGSPVLITRARGPQVSRALFIVMYELAFLRTIYRKDNATAENPVSHRSVITISRAFTAYSNLDSRFLTSSKN